VASHKWGQEEASNEPEMTIISSNCVQVAAGKLASEQKWVKFPLFQE